MNAALYCAKETEAKHAPQSANVQARRISPQPPAYVRNPAQGCDGRYAINSFYKCHSKRSVTTGSIWAARRAGTQQAAIATVSNTAATPEKVKGSRGATPYSSLAR